MAHSNRTKLKASRGGKTRHQFKKANRVAKYANNGAERIRELENWLSGKREKEESVSSRKTVKRTRFSTASRANTRRKNALSRLLVYTPVNEQDTARIASEIATLKKRII